MSRRLVVVGPAPPLRGGIAAHVARLVEACESENTPARCLSWRRLYPWPFFPGTSQRHGTASPAWADERLDALDPATWARARRSLAADEGATVVLEWWHPVLAPALRVALGGLAPARLVAVCHNAVPHEPFPFARAAARSVLGLCARVVCHGSAQVEEVSRLLGPRCPEVVEVPLPPLLDPRGGAGAEDAPPELAGLDPRSRLVVALGHRRAYKGLDVLTEAWRRADLPGSARLVVAGESYLGGRERRLWQRTARSDSRILVLDRYLEDREFLFLLRSAELLVAAHRRASQSGVLPLAEALGVPSLVSDAGALAAQAPGAIVVPAGDAASLALALTRALRAGDGDRSAAPDPEAISRRYREGWSRVLRAILEGKDFRLPSSMGSRGSGRWR